MVRATFPERSDVRKPGWPVPGFEDDLVLWMVLEACNDLALLPSNGHAFRVLSAMAP